MAMIARLAAAEPGLPSDRRIDALGDEGAARIARRHVDDVEIRFLETRLGEQNVEIELRDRALIHRDLLALEIGDRLDVLVGDDAVAAVRVVDGDDILEVVRRLHIEERRIDGAGDHVDTVRHHGGEALLGVFHHDEIDIDAVLLEDALVARDVERAVADAGLAPSRPPITNDAESAITAPRSFRITSASLT